MFWYKKGFNPQVSKLVIRARNQWNLCPTWWGSKFNYDKNPSTWRAKMTRFLTFLSFSPVWPNTPGYRLLIVNFITKNSCIWDTISPKSLKVFETRMENKSLLSVIGWIAVASKWSPLIDWEEENFPSYFLGNFNQNVWFPERFIFWHGSYESHDNFLA